MYAVIETGGKQYRVEVGTELAVEYLDVEPGSTITLERVLLVADGADASIGRPIVADATVSAEVLRQDRGKKVISFKYQPKARRRVKKGHRQELTILRVTDVRLGGKSAAESARAAEEASKTERQRLQEAAQRQAAQDAALAAKLAERTKPAAPEAGATAPKTRASRSAKAEATESPSETAAPEATAANETATPKRSRAKADAAPEAAEPVAEASAETPAEASAETPAEPVIAAGETDETAERPAPKRSRAKKDE